MQDSPQNGVLQDNIWKIILLYFLLEKLLSIQLEI